MQSITHFLQKLNENNDREWFLKNKPAYETERKLFEALVSDVIGVIRSADPSVGTPEVKDVIFRINRDIRFSKDKSPYKTHFGAYIANGGRKSILPGYYFHIGHDRAFFGGGVHQPEAAVLKGIRQEVYYNYPEFKRIISGKDFVKRFGELWDDDKLKLNPKGFPADFEGMDYLKHKSYFVIQDLDDVVHSRDLVLKEIRDAVKLIEPFNRFFMPVFEG